MKQTIQTYLLVFALISATASGIVWIGDYVKDEISPVQAQTTENTNKINTVELKIVEANTKLDFLVEEKGAKYDSERGIIIKKWTIQEQI